MEFLDKPQSRQVLYLTVCISLLVHLVVLLLPASQPKPQKPQQQLNVRLTPRTVGTPPQPQPPQPPPRPSTSAEKSPAPGRTKPRPRDVAPSQNRPVLTSPLPSPAVVDQPQYTQAERDDINNFLDSLGPRKAPAEARGSLSERSATMAREADRGTLRQRDGDSNISVEKIPDSPPINRLTLEYYLDALVSKLNRNAKFMKRPEGGGYGTAAMQVRINPDGTLRSLNVLDESDQKDQVDYIKRLIERSAPYLPFPTSMAASAKSLGITICIRPGQDGEFGFSRSVRGAGSC